MILNLLTLLVSIYISALAADFVAGSVLEKRIEEITSRITEDEAFKNAGEYLSLFQYDPILGFNVKPGSRASGITHSLSGTRGQFHPFEKPPGVRRVVLLGDSQVWGWMVKDDQTISEYLARCLDKAEREGSVGGGNRFEVINLGVVSYSVEQSLLKLLFEGVRYQPDHVIFVIFPENDVDEIQLQKANGLPKPIFLLKDERLQFSNIPVPRSVSWSMQSSLENGSLGFKYQPSLTLANLRVLLLSSDSFGPMLQSILGSFTSSGLYGLPLLRTYVPELEGERPPIKPAFENGLSVLAPLLEVMSKVSRDRGADFSVYVKPKELEVREGVRDEKTLKIIEAARSVAPVEDILPDLRLSGENPDKLLLPYAHLSAKGNAIMAEHMCKRLLSSFKD